jgi:hypothetical protein
MGVDLNFSDRWAELWGIVLLIIGFFAAMTAQTSISVYLITFIFGTLFGRWLWHLRRAFRGSTFTILLGFLIGVMLGAQFGDRKLIIVLFIVGIGVSVYAHQRNIVCCAQY